MASASAKTFAIAELLEAILINLPARDLFVVQRINQTWHDCIEDSSPLQRKMFLKPISPPIDHLAQHPLAYEHDDCRLLYSSPIQLNPCLDISGCATATASMCDLVESTPIGAVRVTSRPGEDEIEVGIELRKWSEERKSTSENESWRGTLLSQPPITELKVRYYLWSKRSKRSEEEVMTIRNPKGLTLGDLVNAWQTIRKHGFKLSLSPEDAFVKFSVVAPPEWVLCDTDEDYGFFTTCYLETPDEVGNCQCVRALRAEE
ncbi:hypothetical protein HII31_06462 [Pseudocercospora fuligena]|uniref:F-box domain-containing protein n=1 Tax=Pseudocercospora fuligena TaxID=685502 RepID=A0A8H6RGJ2_9PEZI|nr:hypothetical protein HII31_06462 [Pseudocercospora fuligena]